MIFFFWVVHSLKWTRTHLVSMLLCRLLLPFYGRLKPSAHPSISPPAATTTSATFLFKSSCRTVSIVQIVVVVVVGKKCCLIFWQRFHHPYVYNNNNNNRIIAYDKIERARTIFEDVNNIIAAGLFKQVFGERIWQNKNKTSNDFFVPSSTCVGVLRNNGKVGYLQKGVVVLRIW